MTRFSRLNNEAKMPLGTVDGSRVEGFSSNFDSVSIARDSGTRAMNNGYDLVPTTTQHTTYVSAPDDLPDHADPWQSKKKKRTFSSLWSIGTGIPVSNLRFPRFVSPWSHPAPKNDSPEAPLPSTARVFDRSQQWRRLFLNGFFQWLVTVVFTVALFGLLFGFSRPPIITKSQRYAFNALITLASLCLGLAVVSALQGYAKLLSWRLLAAEYRTLQDFELVMQCSSQTKVLKLLWAGRTPRQWWPNWTQFFCIMSLLLVIGLQVVISLLGLTYSVDVSTGYVEPVYGNTSVVDLSYVHSLLDSEYDTDFRVQSGYANFYGEAAQDYGELSQQPDSDSGTDKAIYTFNNRTFFYKFIDCPEEGCGDLNIVSEREVNVTAKCEQLEIIDGGYYINSTLNYTDLLGRPATLYTGDNLISGYTTWMSNNNETCGERCTTVLALNVGLEATEDTALLTPWLFTCNCTVGQVSHLDDYGDLAANYSIPAETARLLAGAVGWSGFDYGGDLQYRTYPAGSRYNWNSDDNDELWRWIYKNATGMAYLVTTFATKAIAGMDSSGPRIIVDGYYPTQAQTLNVEWQWSIIVLAVVPGIQFLTLIAVAIFANGAVIKDDSYLAAARLLRPVVEQLGNHGCVLTGDEIARKLDNYKIVYGARKVDNAETGVDWHLDVIREKEGYGEKAIEGWKPNKRLPQGLYDGGVEHEVCIQQDEKDALLGEGAV